MNKKQYLLQRFILSLLVVKQLLRGYFYAFFMRKVGKDFQIGENVHISGMHNIEIGNNIHIHNNCYLLGAGGITIEDNVLFSPGVKIYSLGHNFDNIHKDIMIQGGYYKPVVIKKGGWICADSIILPGIIIGKHAVVGAGSVVNRNVDDYTLVAGVPAKIIRKIK